MHRARKARWLAALMALLMLWGVSASAVASLGCMLGACRHGCPMTARSLPVAPTRSEKDPAGCCKSKAAEKAPRPAMGSEGATGSDCSCQLTRVPLSSQAIHPIVAIPPVPALAGLPDDLPEILLPPRPRTQEILAYADPSPPPVPWHPDFGRAPPTH